MIDANKRQCRNQKLNESPNSNLHSHIKITIINKHYRRRSPTIIQFLLSTYMDVSKGNTYNSLETEEPRERQSTVW